MLQLFYDKNIGNMFAGEKKNSIRKTLFKHLKHAT